MIRRQYPTHRPGSVGLQHEAIGWGVRPLAADPMAPDPPLYWEQALGDLDAALDRFKDARWTRDFIAEQRRALADALSQLYSLREHLLHSLGKGPYFVLAAQLGRPGLVTEGISLIRGARVHDVLTAPGSRTGFAYPGERLYPSSNLFADERNVFWVPRSQMSTDIAARESAASPRPEAYDEHVAGFLVADTLDTARAFLASAHSNCPRCNR